MKNLTELSCLLIALCCSGYLVMNYLDQTQPPMIYAEGPHYEEQKTYASEIKSYSEAYNQAFGKSPTNVRIQTN